MANSVITKVTGTDSSSNRIASTFYGTCSTGASTAAKAVTLSDSCVFTDSCLVTGATIHVKFTNSNTNATPTLKVGTATAKQIMSRGTTKAGTTPETSWYEGAVVSFTYDGTYWQMNDHIDAVDEKVKQTSYPTTASVDPETEYPYTPVLLGKPFDTTFSANTSDAYAAKGLQYTPGNLSISNEYYQGDYDHRTVDTNLKSIGFYTAIMRDDSAAFHNTAASTDAWSYLGDESEAGVNAYSSYEPSEQTPHAKEGNAQITSHSGESELLLSRNYYSQDLNKFSVIELYPIADVSTDELMTLNLNSSYGNIPIISCVYNEDTGDIELNEDCLIAEEIDRGGVALTQAEYDALPSSKLTDGVNYFITDRNNTGATYAAGIAYDNTTSGLSATTVQSAIDELSTNLIQLKTVSLLCTQLTQGFNLTNYVVLDAGYKFLCWLPTGSSDGWTTSFPIYLANVNLPQGNVYWNGTMGSGTNRVRFSYLEIRGA